MQRVTPQADPGFPVPRQILISRGSLANTCNSGTGTQVSPQSSCSTNAAGPPHIYHHLLYPFHTNFNLLHANHGQFYP